MRRIRFRAVIFVLPLLAGCHSARQAPQVDAVAPATSAIATTELKPIPGPAAAHPAPGPAAVNLDKSESNATAHPDDVAAQRDAAYCYYKLEAFAQAVPALQKVVKMAPTATSDRFLLAYSQMAVGTLDDAVATLLSITAQKGLASKDVGEAYLQIGNCHWKLGHDDLAIEAFTRCLAATPHQGKASLALGTYDAGKGKREAARTHFADAVRDLPPGRDRAQAYACLGRLAEEAKDGKAAAEAYRQALALDPANSWAKRGAERLTPHKS
jgi:tetratricopeptide (TPR) repeat protein